MNEERITPIWIRLELGEQPIPTALSLIAMRIHVDAGRLVKLASSHIVDDIHQWDGDTLLLSCDPDVIWPYFDEVTEMNSWINAIGQIYPIDEETRCATINPFPERHLY